MSRERPGSRPLATFKFLYRGMIGLYKAGLMPFSRKVVQKTVTKQLANPSEGSIKDAVSNRPEGEQPKESNKASAQNVTPSRTQQDSGSMVRSPGAVTGRSPTMSPTQALHPSIPDTKVKNAIRAFYKHPSADLKGKSEKQRGIAEKRKLSTEHKDPEVAPDSENSTLLGENDGFSGIFVSKKSTLCEENPAQKAKRRKIEVENQRAKVMGKIQEEQELLQTLEAETKKTEALLVSTLTRTKRTTI